MNANPPEAKSRPPHTATEDGAAADATTAQPSVWRTGVTLGLAALLPAAVVLGLANQLQPAAEAIRAQGLWTAPLFIVLAGVFAGFALTPTHLVSVIAGYAFGFALGLPSAMGAVLLATVIGHHVAGRLTHEQMRQWIAQRPVGRVLADAMLEGATGRTILALTLARLPPQVPFAMGNVLAASLGVGRIELFVGTALGMLPRVALVVWVGAAMSQWRPDQQPPLSLFIALVGAAVGFGGLALWSWLILRRTRAQLA